MRIDIDPVDVRQEDAASFGDRETPIAFSSLVELRLATFGLLFRAICDVLVQIPVQKMLVRLMLVRLTPKSTRFGDDFVGTLAHWMLARLSPLHFGCCHEPVYSPSYVGATACPLIPSNDRNALNG